VVVDGRRLGPARERHAPAAFNVVDDFTRECLAIEVDTSIPGPHLLWVVLEWNPKQPTITALAAYSPAQVLVSEGA